MARAGHPEQILGKSILDFVKAPGQQGIALGDLAKVALGGSPRPVIYELQRLDGETAAGHVASVPMMFRGQPAMLSLVTDVSDRERVIRELEESEERYRLLLDNTPSGIVVVQDERVVFANRSLARALGYDGTDDLLGMSVYEHIAEEYRKPVRDARRQLMRTGKTIPAAAVELVRRDGERVPTTAVTTLIRWKGELATQTLMHDLAL